LDLDGSFAYSDSVTDLPMLETVGHPVAVNPDRALLKEATSRGWEIRVFERPQPLVEGRGVRPPKPMTFGALGAATLAGGLLWWKTRKPTGRRR
ncbi:MAG: HAD-IB family hydrolase, partial [Actinomycetota bacterium]|nr:HAD-IB family hydrolase [Actinomycetota bacterium]